MVVECDEGSKVASGERFGGVGWGIVLSNISDRSNVENVRFASSAAKRISYWLKGDFYSFLTPLEMKLAVRRSFFLL